ncbi:signal peptidase II [Primorskyibacter sp. S87]|uniref:signal peptidase II n=1 Tax=Primorskyibacter sp. S87 TaxID=3415126 RepID=UPI003C7C8538
MPMRATFWAAFWAFLIDQLSKYLVVHAMDLSRVHVIKVWPPFLTFRYGENQGINFGLFQDDSDLMRWILVGFSVAVCIAVIWWVRRCKGGIGMQIGAGLMVGGALGNVVDRLLYGYVLDFLNMSCCGIDNPYVFNIADVFIFGGAAALFLFEPRGQNRKKTP